jgi:hypothetical protein
MAVDDPLPYYRRGIEWLTLLIEDYLGYGPANLWPLLGVAGLFGASVSVQVLVSEARQAQTEIAAAIAMACDITADAVSQDEIEAAGLGPLLQQADQQLKEDTDRLMEH